MKKHYLLTFLFSFQLALVSGCAVSQYDSPLKLSDELKHFQSGTMTKIADTAWWKQYDNTELNRLIETALANNPDYIKAALNINKELYNLNLSKLDLFPILSGDLNASSQRRIDSKDNFASNFSGELGLKYEADLYGRIRNLRDAQEFEYKATIMDWKAARLSLVNSVIDLYFNLEYLNNATAVTKENITAYQNIQNITEAKYKGGRSDNLEFLQSTQSLLSEQNKLLELETQFKEMSTNLNNILNTQSDVASTISFGDILQQKTLNINMDVPLSILAHRPDLQASQYRLEKAFKNLTAENKNWYPAVSLQGALGSSSDKARTTFDFPFIFGSVAVDLPFLDWNRVKNNIKISETDYQLAAVEFKDILNQAINEVGYYYTAYAKMGSIYENTTANYDNSIKITQYYQTRYNIGKIEFKDYLEALNKQNALQNELLEQKYQIIKYENYIYKAMGGKY